jgi:hypothetical protein
MVVILLISNKQEFLKNFLPDKVQNIEYTQINIDTTDLSISDILRNIHKIYPKNSRNRIAIESGTLVVGVLCKTETLFPYKGLFLLIVENGLEVNIVSSDYIVMSISENRICDEDLIVDLIDDITRYMISNYSETLRDFKDLYNESELYEDDDIPANYRFINY